MRNSHATWAFLADLAAGRLLERQGRWWIERAGTGIDLGPMSGTAGIEVFEGLLRRVVIDEIGIDGRTIPPADGGWGAGPDEAWAALEAHPLLVGTAGRPEWTAWRTVVWGLALEHGRLPVPA